ncbi:MAG: tRNA preQ1(34) S-adenosylmethionine ribosyltransferase-isomerase QueA [Candidatus Omnitrophica bacterium]|nr:tRNA preQ1(34) S-adenosylmethionine ribosyltransferase-isomerase QueA [Candidatus Omnitrophota bacterium]
MKLSDFYYELPKESVAQVPLKERDAARLMVLDRASGSISERVFRDITEYMREGDCLILNNTRVVPARFYGKRRTGGNVEIFLLDTDSDPPRALIRPSKRVKDGEMIELENGLCAEVLGRADTGRFVRFDVPLREALKRGHVPLPPYISREDSPEDREYYQTVYGCVDGATAAPTAGLHFTSDLFERLRAGGVRIGYITLHTSYGSFAPIRTENIEDHRMHSESFDINGRVADLVSETKRSGGRVFAVGTTSTRVLETAAADRCEVASLRGRTDLFIYPGYDFKAVDSMITNFHLPGSTLLMLVCAFAGRDLIFKAYRKAIEAGFRFYSYGDAMLII